MNDIAAVPALTVDGLVCGIGPLTILQGVSLAVQAREVVVVLGANGAGKTALLRTIAGLITPRAGSIRLFGEAITGWPAHRIARAGIGHVPSGRELFPRLTVADHLELGGRFCTPARRAELRRRLYEMFPVLAERAAQRAGTLSGDRKSTRLNSSHTVIYPLSLHDALPIWAFLHPGPARRIASAPVRDVPRPCRAGRAAGGHIVRRRTADGGDRPGIDDRSPRAAAGRAVDRAGPEDRVGPVPDLSRTAPPGGQHSARRTEPLARAERGGPRLCHRSRPHCARRDRRRTGRR